MKPATKEFKRAAAEALGAESIQSSLSGLYDGLHQARITAGEATPDWEAMRDRGRAIKAHTIANLDHYLELAERNVTSSGGKIFFARDADAASSYVLDLARSKGVKLVTKGKSMLSEEMGLNQKLIDQGIEPVETDLGEYIIQLAEETPFHIIAPAIHKTKSEVSRLFEEKLGSPWYDEPTDLTQEARRQLREKFIHADMGITGANFLVAETGTLVLVSNEGNGRMCTSMPKIHVAIMGMEKVVPSMQDLSVLLPLLIRSATGQRISSYVTFVNGPRADEEEDGPEEFHLVIVDNGRSRLLADPDLRESLYCIRCAACLNACPVYRKVGGHAYGWVYSGPIGAVISPVLTDLKEAKDLPYASSLCGACREACPVRIDLPRMLLHLRRQIAEEAGSVSWAERLAMRAWRLTLSSTAVLRLARLVVRLAQWPLSRSGRLRWLPPPLSGWTRHRTFPALAATPFRSRWKSLRKERRFLHRDEVADGENE